MGGPAIRRRAYARPAIQSGSQGGKCTRGGMAGPATSLPRCLPPRLLGPIGGKDSAANSHPPISRFRTDLQDSSPIVAFGRAPLRPLGVGDCGVSQVYHMYLRRPYRRSMHGGRNWRPEAVNPDSGRSGRQFSGPEIPRRCVLIRDFRLYPQRRRPPIRNWRRGDPLRIPPSFLRTDSHAKLRPSERRCRLR